MAQDLIDRFTPIHSHPINLTSGIATWVLRSGHRALKFVQGGGTTAYFASVMNSLYNGTGIIVTVVWTAGATTAGVQWTVGFERQQADVYNYTSGLIIPTFKTTIAGALAGANKATYTQIQFAASDLGSLAALESYRMTLHRADAVAMDAFVYRVFLQNRT
jgi:hypothetical protein